MRRCLSLIVLLTLLWAGPALALHPDEILTDPVLEQRARIITHGVRCLVCQGEAIDESQAPLAADLRRLVRQRLLLGESDDQIRHFLTQRYGDYILMQPPLAGRTLFLWGGPLAVLLIAGLLLWRLKRRSDRAGAGG